jgi:hypothetical protein
MDRFTFNFAYSFRRRGKSASCALGSMALAAVLSAIEKQNSVAEAGPSGMAAQAHLKS